MVVLTEEAQVDYGEGAPTRVAGTNRFRKPRLFVMTLRYSRRSFCRVAWKSSKEIWARLHEDAWRYFGGSCRYEPSFATTSSPMSNGWPASVLVRVHGSSRIVSALLAGAKSSALAIFNWWSITFAFWFCLGNRQSSALTGKTVEVSLSKKGAAIGCTPNTQSCRSFAPSVS